MPGLGDAKNWPLETIRNLTNRPSLVAGTLNLHVPEAHAVRQDFVLPVKDRTDGRNEDLYFEECFLLIFANKITALIARTSTNFHGCKVLEVMASEHLRSKYGLQDLDIIEIEVRPEAT